MIPIEAAGFALEIHSFLEALGAFRTGSSVYGVFGIYSDYDYVVLCSERMDSQLLDLGFRVCDSSGDIPQSFEGFAPKVVYEYLESGNRKINVLAMKTTGDFDRMVYATAQMEMQAPIFNKYDRYREFLKHVEAYSCDSPT